MTLVRPIFRIDGCSRIEHVGELPVRSDVSVLQGLVMAVDAMSLHKMMPTLTVSALAVPRRLFPVYCLFGCDEQRLYRTGALEAYSAFAHARSSTWAAPTCGLGRAVPDGRHHGREREASCGISPASSWWRAWGELCQPDVIVVSCFE